MNTPGLLIGMVTHYMPPHVGGIETVAQELFDVYAAAGYEVRWITSRVPSTAPARDGGRIRVACWNGLERWLGVPWPVWGLDGAREVTRLVQWADVLHVHDCLYLGSALAVCFGQKLRKPTLLSQHIGFVRYPSKVLNLMEHVAYRTLGKVVLRRASHVVFCTPAAEEFVTALLGMRPLSATTIPNGIDTRRFKPATADERINARRKLNLTASGPLVLFAGRLVEKKGVGLFVEVGRRTPSMRFLIVGDGPLRPPPMNNVTWIPHLPRDRMETAYHAADLLLLPSHGEGFPVAALEAMAVGLPIIASKGEVFASLLEREGSCVAAERTATAFCEALNRLWTTPGLASVMGTRARELVVRKWDLAVMAVRYLELIRSMVGAQE